MPAGLDLENYESFRQHLFFWHASEPDGVLKAHSYDRSLILKLPRRVKSHLGVYARHREMMQRHLVATGSACTIEVYAEEHAPDHEAEFQQSLKARLEPRRRLGNGKKKPPREQQKGKKVKVPQETKTSQAAANKKRKRDAKDSDFNEEDDVKTSASGKKKVKVSRGPEGTLKRTKKGKKATSKVKAE